MRGTVASEEPLGEHRDIHLALAQGRQPDGERIDTVVQVFAEATIADELLEWAVGRGNEPEVHRDRFVPAQPFESSLLEHAQQLGLGDEGQVPDLVEEQRSVARQLEPSWLPVVRAGEGALFVAEDLGLEERVRQRGAVDRLQLRLRAPAQLVDHACDDFLARPGRPEDQHRDVGLGGRADPLEDDQHLLVAADHFAEALNRGRLIFGADCGAPLEEMIEQLPRVPDWPAARRCTWSEGPTRLERRRNRQARARSSRRPDAVARTSASAIRRRMLPGDASTGTAGYRPGVATELRCESVHPDLAVRPGGSDWPPTLSGR